MVCTGCNIYHIRSWEHVKHGETRSDGRTRRSKDGSFTKKNNKTFFGYKGHTIVYDNIPVPVYRDKGYFGHDPKGIDGTMDRSVMNHKLSIESIRRNLRTSRKRSLVEYPYEIMKRLFHFSHVMVTTVKRVRVKFMFACFAYNVHALKIING
jgi:IS5 family transposase